MVLMIFLPQIKYIFGTSSFIQLEDQMGQHRNNKRKFDVLSADSCEEHTLDQFPCPNSNLQDGYDAFYGNDKADSFPSYFKKIKNQVNLISLDQQNESRTNEDFEKMKNKNNEKDEIIKILNQYAQTQDEHIKLCIENFNKLIEFETLFYSLNSFRKLTKYLRHKSNDKNSPKTSLDWEYDIYFDCFKLLVTFLFNKILVSKHFFVNGDKIENKTNVKPIENAKFTDYLDCILASYWGFSHYVELEASKILVKLCNGFRIFVINVENQEDISLKVVYEILGWLKTTYLYFYFKSELNCIETNLSKIDKYKCITLATQLCCFHFYSLKTIVKNNLFSGTIMTENEYLEMLKNEAFLADLISLKYILREIIGNIFKKHYRLADIYKITNFFLFVRLFYRDKLQSFTNLDFFLIKENFTNEGLKKFNREAGKIIRLKKFSNFNERQKQIFIIYLVKEQILKGKNMKYIDALRIMADHENFR